LGAETCAAFTEARTVAEAPALILGAVDWAAALAAWLPACLRSLLCPSRCRTHCRGHGTLGWESHFTPGVVRPPARAR